MTFLLLFLSKDKKLIGKSVLFALPAYLLRLAHSQTGLSPQFKQNSDSELLSLIYRSLEDVSELRMGHFNLVTVATLLQR